MIERYEGLVYRRFGIDQSLRTLVMSFEAGFHERRPPGVVHHVHRCARIDQSPRAFMMTIDAGVHERRHSTFIYFIENVTSCDSLAQRLQVSPPCRVIQCRVTHEREETKNLTRGHGSFILGISSL